MTAPIHLNERIAVIGGGQMARALIGGWIAAGLSPEQIVVADPAQAQLNWFQEHFPQVACTADNAQAAANAKIWLLAVKPQLLAPVACALKALAQRQQPLVISIVAGIHATNIVRWLGPVTLIRTMPNRPAFVGAGITALHAASEVPALGRDVATNLLAAVGKVVWVEHEQQLDLVTAISGSGPAYFFLLMEALETAAIARGLTPQIARELVLHTASGAAKLALQSLDDPATLRAQVTSKGGTTAAAVAVFEEAQLGKIVDRAVEAAAQRSVLLAREFGDTDP
jgi:pyrroline-5-carboxylate reductase